MNEKLKQNRLLRERGEDSSVSHSPNDRTSSADLQRNVLFRNNGICYHLNLLSLPVYLWASPMHHSKGLIAWYNLEAICCHNSDTVSYKKECIAIYFTIFGNRILILYWLCSHVFVSLLVFMVLICMTFMYNEKLDYLFIFALLLREREREKWGEGVIYLFCSVLLSSKFHTIPILQYNRCQVTILRNWYLCFIICDYSINTVEC